MFKFVAIFIGGGLGACSRYLLSTHFTNLFPFFPFGTLFVNVLGSFILGLSYALFLEKIAIQSEYQAFITIGFCGALTTFSAFSLDVWNLFLEGHILKGIIYVMLNLILTLLALGAGVFIAKQF